MTAAAASVISSAIALLVAIAAIFTSLYKRGVLEGRQAEILSHLSKIASDHETRLRDLERPPRK